MRKIIFLMISLFIVSSAYAVETTSIVVINSPQRHDTILDGANASTLFSAGSITKTFVSAIILKLEAQDKLNINQPLGDFLPQYPKWKHVTLKELLNMTSGIADTFSIQKAYHTKDAFAPGKAWKYSNTNYLLLGEVIEKVTHQSLSQNFQEKLFKPLDLEKVMFDKNKYGAAGGIMINSKDLQKWISDLFIKQIVLPQKQFKEMMTTVPIPKTTLRPENTRYGLGVYVSDDKQFGHMIWYVGVIKGYSSAFFYFPDKDTLVTAQLRGWEKPHFNILFPNQLFMQKVFARLSEST